MSNYTVNLTPGTLTVNKATLDYTIGNDAQTYGTPAVFATDLGTTIPTGVNGETLDIAYSSTGDTTTADASTYAITGVASDGSGPIEQLHGQPHQRHVDGPQGDARLHDCQRQPRPTARRRSSPRTLARRFHGVNGETLDIAYSSTGDTTTADASTYAITGVASDGSGLLSNYTVNLTPAP